MIVQKYLTRITRRVIHALPVLRMAGRRFLANYPILVGLLTIGLMTAYFFWWLRYDVGWHGYWFQIEIWIRNHPDTLTKIYTSVGLLLIALIIGIVVISNKAARHVYRLDDLDYKIWLHQRSTRTLIPAFIPMHEWLSLRYAPYRKWHSQRLTRELHVYTMLLFVGVVGFLLFKSTAIPSVEASHGCADAVNITGNTTWSTNQCHGDVTITNGATLTIAGNTTHSLVSLTLGNGVTNGFITAQGDTVNGVGVVINVDNNVEVKSNSSISANSQGYTTGAGPGTGSGSSRGAAHGGMGLGSSGVNANTYGSATAPVTLGSGGTHYVGGGAVKIVIGGNLTNNGTISANGDGACGACQGGGSGGSVWIDFSGGSSTWEGSGSITANASWNGGGGRVAVTDYVNDTHSGTTSTYETTSGSAAPGTVYLKSSAQTYGTLRVDNNGVAVNTTNAVFAHAGVSSLTLDSLVVQNNGPLQIPNTHTITIASGGSTSGTSSGALNIANGGTLNTANITTVAGPIITNSSGGTFTPASSWTLSTNLIQRGTLTPTTTDLTVASGGTFTADTATTLDDITVQSGGNMTHTANTTTEAYTMNVTATNITVDSGGTINANSKGYSNGGPGVGAGGSPCATFAGAGGYGGMAGNGTGGGTYGSATAPVNIGSSSQNSQPGGGAIKLTLSGNLANSGAISAEGADGGSGCAGGGSGGSVWVNFTGGSSTWSGNGSISGSAAGTFSQAGGGRVAVIGHVTDTHGGTTTAYGKNGGSAGTVYLKSSAQTNGTLLIDNNSVATNAGKYARSGVASLMLDGFTVQNRGAYDVPSGSTVTLAASTTLTVAANSILNNGGTITLGSGGTLAGASSGSITNGGTFDVNSVSPIAGATITNTGTISNLPSSWTLSTTLIQRGTIAASSTDLTIASGGTLTADVATTIDDLIIQSGGNMNHTANTTSKVYAIDLTATNVTIDSGGTINVKDKGYSAGNGPGAGAGGSPCSTWAGPGGYGGMGGRGTGGATYGSATAPTDLGSGSQFDSSGGGAIKLTISGNLTNNSTISAEGGDGSAPCSGGGSGGSVWINFTGGSSTWSGNGTITAQASSVNSWAGGGRVAVTGYVTDSHAGSTNAYASRWFSGLGANGTVYLKSSTQTYGTLLLDNNGVAQASGKYARKGTSSDSASLTLDALTLQNGGTFDLPSTASITLAASGTFTGNTNTVLNNAGTITLNATSSMAGASSGAFSNSGTFNTAGVTPITGPTITNTGTISNVASSWTLSTNLIQRATLSPSGTNITVASGGTFTADVATTFADITVQSGGNMTHTANTTTEAYTMNVTATNITVNTGGTIDVKAKGYSAGNGPGAGAGGNPCQGVAGGAGYGGMGAIGTGGGTYGSPTAPTNLGSGGQTQGSGGGAIKLTISGNLANSGTISAEGGDGNAGCAGGGSGGSVWVNFTGGSSAWSGNGTITARASTSNSAGGGGRVAVTGYVTDTHGGATTSYGSTTYSGAPGTVYTKSSAQTYGTLVIDNNNVSVSSGKYARKSASSDTDSLTLDTVVVQNRGTFHLPSTATLTASGKTVGANSTLWNQGTISGSTGTDSISGTLTSDGPIAFGNLTINSGGVFTHSDNASTEASRLVATAASVTVSTGGLIDVNGLGYDGGAADAAGAGSTTGKGALGGTNSAGGGGGYGGIGGTGGGASGGTGGATYGSQTAPTNIGSGGGGGDSAGGGSGGGAIQLTITGNLTVAGTIRANGNAGNAGTYGGGGGSGGSIFLTVNGNLNCTGGVITANGGNGAGSTQVGGGGGGGRISQIVRGLYTACATRTASGGTGGTGTGAGTVYEENGPAAPTTGAASNITTTSIRWNWTDNSANEDSFKLHNSSHGEIASITSTTEGTTGTSYNSTESSLSPNTTYTRHLHASKTGIGEGAASADMTATTLANTPGTPATIAVLDTSVGVVININSNPAATEFAIYESTTNKYVQTNGSLNTSAAWQTYSTWGGANGKTVTGLTSNANYTFAVKARNADATETTLSSTASTTTLPGAPDSATWPFTNSSDYTFDNTKIEVTSGNGQLIGKTPGSDWIATSGGTNWSYRKAITIDNTAGGSLTNFQVLVILNTSTLVSQSKLQSDCDDIRFTDDNGLTELSYYIESGCNSTTTRTWVKVPSISASSNKTIYFYYSHATVAAASSGTNTFDFFDDFSTNTSANYTPLGSASISYDSVNKVLKQTNTTQSFSWVVSENDSLGSSYVYQADVKVASDPSNRKHSGAITDFSLAAVTGYRLVHLDTSFPISKWTNGTETSIGSIATDNYTANQWQTYQVDRNRSTGLLRLKVTNSGTTVTSTDFTDTTHTTGHIGFFTYGNESWFDNVIVRKFASTEPSSNAGSEQGRYAADSPTIVNTSPLPSYDNLYAFTETLGSGSAGTVKYQLSPNAGTTWYWHNGSSWTLTSAGVSESNDSATVNLYITEFDSVGSGTKNFTWRAFLTSDGTQLPKIDNITLNYASNPGSPTSPSVSGATTSSLRWNWTDNSTNETSFVLYNTADNSIVATIPSTTTGTTGTQYSSVENNLSPNTQYTHHIKSRNAVGLESSTSGTVSGYTLATTPLAPTLSNPSSSSLTVSINPGSNPTGNQTTFSLKETTSGLFLQSNGTLGSTEVKQTYAQWGGSSGTVVTGLTPSTIYTFVTYAHNGDGVATAASNSTSLSTTGPPATDTGTDGSGGDTSDDTTEEKPKKKGDSANTGGNSGGTTTPRGDNSDNQPGVGNGPDGSLEECDQGNFFDLLFGWLGGRNKTDSPCVPADPPADPPCFLWCTVNLRVQITPPGGTFTDTTKATLSHTPSDEPADIYFTVDGTEPSQYSILYRRPLYISEDLTVNAKAYSPASDTAFAQFVINRGEASEAQKITISASPGSGIYSQPVTVTLTASDADATIYYSTDGSSPLTKRLAYLGPLTLSQSSALTFYAEDEEGNASSVEQEQYIITSVHVPVTLEWEPITEETTEPLTYEVMCNNSVIAATPLNSYLDTRTRPDGCTYAVFAVADGERKPVTISGISAEPRILENLDQGPILTVLKSGWTYWGLILGALVGLAGGIRLFFQWLWYLLRLALLLPPYWWGRHKKPNMHGVVRKAGLGEALPYAIVSLVREKGGKDVSLSSKEGIFGFAARAGQYTIQVFKPGFEISKDERVGNYHGEVLTVVPNQDIERIIVCFPTIFADPKTVREARLMLLSLALRFVILFFGMLIGILLFLHAVTVWNAIVVVLYLVSWVVTLLRLRRRASSHSTLSTPVGGNAV